MAKRIIRTNYNLFEGKLLWKDLVTRGAHQIDISLIFIINDRRVFPSICMRGIEIIRQPNKNQQTWVRKGYICFFIIINRYYYLLNEEREEERLFWPVSVINIVLIRPNCVCVRSVRTHCTLFYTHSVLIFSILLILIFIIIDNRSWSVVSVSRFAFQIHCYYHRALNCFQIVCLSFVSRIRVFVPLSCSFITGNTHFSIIDTNDDTMWLKYSKKKWEKKPMRKKQERETKRMEKIW